MISIAIIKKANCGLYIKYLSLLIIGKNDTPKIFTKFPHKISGSKNISPKIQNQIFCAFVILYTISLKRKEKSSTLEFLYSAVLPSLAR